MSIGARIKEIRKAHGIRATHVNKQLGRSTGWLSNIESGRNDISAVDLKAVADVMRIPIRDFYGVGKYLTPEQRVIVSALADCIKTGTDPDTLNTVIGKPSGWLQQIPRDITPTQLAQVVNTLGYSLDAAAHIQR